MKLTDEYNAEIAKDYLSIKVGCQTIDITTIRSLVSKIEKDSGKTLDQLESERLEQLKNVPKKITDLIHSFEDAVEYTKFVIPDYWQFLPKDTLAYERIKVVISVLNEDWIADWNDSSQRKYYCYWNMGSSGVGFSYYDYGNQFTYSNLCSGLCLSSYQLCQHIGNSPKLVEEFKNYMVK